MTEDQIAVLKQELDKAVELNEWYRKRCVWYQQELDAQSRAETARSLRDMQRAEAAEQERGERDSIREQVCADLRRELEMTRQRAEAAEVIARKQESHTC